MASFTQSTLKFLATIAVAVSSGMADPASSLLQVPEEALVEVVEEADKRHWHASDRKRLLGLIARDSRTDVRAVVAPRVGRVWWDEPAEAATLLRRFVHDGSYRVRLAAAEGLSLLLGQIHPLEAIELVAKWSTAEATQERTAIAMALRTAPPIAVAHLAIDLLAGDSSCIVRRFAAEAAGARFGQDPSAYAEVLSRLTGDPVRSIRWRAGQLLEEARRV